jgi:hypothetical protein
LYRLKKGGYPFAVDDLTLEEWQGIGEAVDAIESMRVM